MLSGHGISFLDTGNAQIAQMHSLNPGGFEFVSEVRAPWPNYPESVATKNFVETELVKYKDVLQKHVDSVCITCHSALRAYLEQLIEQKVSESEARFVGAIQSQADALRALGLRLNYQEVAVSELATPPDLLKRASKLQRVEEETVQNDEEKSMDC